MEVLYWVWLSLALGAGAKTKQLLRFFGSPEEMYRAGEVELYLCPFLNAAKVGRMKATPLQDAEQILALCEKNRWSILTPQSSGYPRRLLEMEDHPLVLYVEGELPPVDNRLTVAVVGTRNATQRGISTTYEIAFGLARAGAVVVSGGALGVDTAAHKGALSAEGGTVAVLGTGLGNPYLAQNQKLRELIAQKGALVSEMPPFAPPSTRSFPIRNRIIAGLAQGTLVVEAGVKSGSLLTAGQAKLQGKDLFAVPCFDEFSAAHFGGSKKLLRSGATPVLSATDILNAYAQTPEGEEDILRPARWTERMPQEEAGEKEKSEKNVEKPVENVETAYLSGYEMDIYDLLRKEPRDADEISFLLSVEIREIMTALLNLELKGYIVSDLSHKYRVTQTPMSLSGR